jgi:quercetin dioxygenase-like cupin family protein
MDIRFHCPLIDRLNRNGTRYRKRKMRVYRVSDVQAVMKEGYSASYVADTKLTHSTKTVGVIMVKVSRGKRTKAHAHGVLDEIFIPMGHVKIGVDAAILNLSFGDVLIVNPYEKHWFEAPADEDVTIAAIKLPNLKDDKIS